MGIEEGIGLQVRLGVGVESIDITIRVEIREKISRRSFFHRIQDRYMC